MADTDPPIKRIRYDFTTTFDVIVGSAQGRVRRFPVYHDLLTARSNFLFAARAAEPRQSVRLEDEDPEVFSLYLNCVRSGIEVIRTGGELLGKQAHTEQLVKRERDSEQSVDESEDHLDGGRFEALIRLHLLANKLQDFEMMNLVIDELVRMIDEDGLIPTQVNLVYSSTGRGDSLRSLVRDVYIHEAETPECHEFVQANELHPDFWRDISFEFFRLKDAKKSIGEVYGLKIGKDKGVNRSDYHQRQPDDRVGVVPQLVAGAAAVSKRNHTPVVPQASSRSNHPSAAPAAAITTAQERAPTVPQNSALRDITAATTSPTENHAPAAPQASSRYGRSPDAGSFGFRRPETSDVWWSVSADRFDNASNKERYRYANAGRAQEEGTVCAIPCDRCTRRGYADTCSSLPGGRCGRCLCYKAARGDGC